ncbi:MAG: aminomethyl-transferring glycine dehydrogenase subunit GcvPB [Chitinispirillales bacterium]|jgi:glycine dehydrogenase subunit 2|nr:aminomethyl-transferring glycine dehydrogenase subunit GcvPB [Chitinispirillales bacterium]
MQTIFEKSTAGRKGVTLPKCDVPTGSAVPDRYKRTRPLNLCELSEPDVVRHFTALSRMNFGVDNNLYPLGSCTMKYNPKACERIAALNGFSSIHPMTAQLAGGHRYAQGALAVVRNLEESLCRVTGMDAFTLQPMAGAHGELTGMMLIAAYHRKKGAAKKEVLIPDEAHGTNPASAAAAGFKIRTVPTDPETGLLDVDKLREIISDGTAALMMTNPNTLGLFNPRVAEIAEIVHSRGALLYCDGANMNAVMGKFRPGDCGFDVMHVNLHKTFATPHGGGGPGSGPVGVKAFLEPFLPTPRVRVNAENGYALAPNSDYPDSIGPVAPFYGNFSVCVKAYAYMLMMGGKGLLEVSEQAVLNANYVLHSLMERYEVPYPKTCMHECVLSASRQAEAGVKAVDIAKALIDRGFHPPTVYFPLIVKEALMIEPTETEGKEALDAFIGAMAEIAKIAASDPKSLHACPTTTPVGRLDETKAAREMDVAFL